MDLPGLFDGRRKDVVYLCEGTLPAGVSPGARRIDHVIGIAVDLVLDGKVLKSYASSPQVLEIHKEKKITLTAGAGKEF